MTHNNDYNRLLSMGRRAGLNARELNQALATQPVMGHDQTLGQSDANGYVSEVDSQGHRHVRQVGDSPRG